MIELDQIVERITKESGQEKERVERLIIDKQEELSGLVSKEGAAYIVGRELGVNLIKEGRKEFKIKNLVSDLSFIDLEAKVVKIFDVRTFEKKKGPSKIGTVQNVLVGDETGTVFLVLWGEDIEKMKEIAETDSIKIINAFSKTSGKIGGGIELGLRKRGTIEKIDKKIAVVGTDRGSDFRANRVEIKDLKEEMYADLRGCFVQIMRRSPVYFICPQCSSSLGGQGKCKTHGEVQPNKAAMFTGVLDDGTGTIRLVAFKEIAEKLYGAKADQIDLANLEKFYDEIDLLGKEFVVGGRVKKNNFSGEIEMIVNRLDGIDNKKECEILLKELGVG